MVSWEQAVGKPNPSVRVVKDQPLDIGGVRRRRRAADDGHGREPGVVRPLVLADPEEAGELWLLVPQRRPLADHGLPVPAVHGQKELKVVAERIVVANHQHVENGQVTATR